MSYRYQITVTHPGLGKERILTGYDKYILESLARELTARWNDQYTKRLAVAQRTASRQERQQHVEQSLEDARERTENAKLERESLESLLVEATKALPFKWESLKVRTEYRVAPPLSPTYKNYPVEPVPIVPKIGIFDRLISSRAKSKIEQSAQLNLQRKQQWIQQVKNIQAQNEASLSAYAESVKAWELGRQKHDADCAVQRAAVEQKQLAYEAKDQTAILSVCEIVLSRTAHALLPSPEFELEYNAGSKSLIVEYSLPTPSALPSLKEVRYVKARDEFVDFFYTEADQGRLYDSVVYQICLRVLNDVFQADTVGTLEAITFNGWVTSIDPAKGKETTACIISVTAQRHQFLDVDLAKVEPKACFRSLKGVGSSKLHSITAIAPICTISREDSRFIPAHDVAQGLAEGFNLATMEWEEFEQLIREVFAKEFSINGGEVKITQASRDRGVDAVAFDPDPIRGGKIVIQAKRYTNTVDVSAVRDLYGTVLNEGANKGILVTTADYGPDAYQFAADKPLTLLNGGNLLNLLEKHGQKVRIDLREAKKITINSGASRQYILRTTRS
jgi:restriction system protein